MQISDEEAFEVLKSYRYISGNRGETLMGDWSSNYQTWKEFKLNDKYLLIKYEDLVNNTKLTFIKMLEFIHKVTKFKFVLDEDKLIKSIDSTKFEIHFQEVQRNFFCSSISWNFELVASLLF